MASFGVNFLSKRADYEYVKNPHFLFKKEDFTANYLSRY